MDAEKDFFEKQSDKLENMGVVSRYSRLGRSETRVYVCAVCKKKKYEYPEN